MQVYGLGSEKIELEARYYRVYACYVLLNYFGGFPLRLYEYPLSMQIQNPRDTEEDIKDFVRIECARLVLMASTVGGNISSDEAMQLGARAYFSGSVNDLNLISNGIDFLRGIVNSGNYTLSDSWGDDAISTGISIPDLPENMKKGAMVYPMRYAETLLLFAEGLTKTGDLATAIAVLNIFGVGQELTASSSMLNEIRAAIASLWTTRLDREGLTYAAMRRAGTFLNTMGTYGASSKHLLLPIPRHTLNTNPSLTQNPGW